MIGIINYGIGNIASIENALNYVKLDNKIFSNPEDINQFDKIILPGVGAFGLAMERLNRTNFSDAIKEFVLKKKKPILGICLGMQLLLDYSNEHGKHEGLCMIKGTVDILKNKAKEIRIPHIGWNSIKKKRDSILLKNIEDETCFYFVHSYYCNVWNKSTISATVNYGFSFDIIIETDNIFGCQFHPEKSQQNGLLLLKNFGKL